MVLRPRPELSRRSDAKAVGMKFHTHNFYRYSDFRLPGTNG
jgi:hypothetical protein